MTITTTYGANWNYREPIWAAHDEDWGCFALFRDELAARRHAMAEDLEVTLLETDVAYLHPWLINA